MVPDRRRAHAEPQQRLAQFGDRWLWRQHGSGLQRKTAAFSIGLPRSDTKVKISGVDSLAHNRSLIGRVSAYGTPSMAGRLNPIATHARSSFSMNFPERPG